MRRRSQGDGLISGSPGALASLAFAVGGLVGQAPLRRTGAVGRLGAVQALGVDQFHVALHRPAVEQQCGAERRRRAPPGPTSRRWPGAAGRCRPAAGWRRGPGAGRGWRHGRAGRSATARPPAAAGRRASPAAAKGLGNARRSAANPAARHRAAAPGCRAAVRRSRDDSADTGRAVADAIAVLRRRQGERIAGERGVELAALVDQVGEAAERSHHTVYLQAWLAIVPPGRWSRRPCKAAGERPYLEVPGFQPEESVMASGWANDGAVRNRSTARSRMPSLVRAASCPVARA